MSSSEDETESASASGGVSRTFRGASWVG